MILFAITLKRLLDFNIAAKLTITKRFLAGVAALSRVASEFPKMTIYVFTFINA